MENTFDTHWWGGFSYTRKSPGFRLNGIDLVLLAVCAFASTTMIAMDMLLGGFPLYLFYTFFLYCNVFRISWYFEAIWSVGFVGIVFGMLSILADIEQLGTIEVLLYALGAIFQALLIIAAYHTGHLAGVWRRTA